MQKRRVGGVNIRKENRNLIIKEICLSVIFSIANTIIVGVLLYADVGLLNFNNANGSLNSLLFITLLLYPIGIPLLLTSIFSKIKDGRYLIFVPLGFSLNVLYSIAFGVNYLLKDFEIRRVFESTGIEDIKGTIGIFSVILLFLYIILFCVFSWVFYIVFKKDKKLYK